MRCPEERVPLIKVPLLISTVVEEYVWRWPAVVGLILVMIGNWRVMRSGKT